MKSISGHLEDEARKKARLKMIIAGAVASIATAGAGAAVTHVIDKPAPVPSERCYGVVAAGQNDCLTVANSCAGTATQGGLVDTFIDVPMGLCKKISGGKTEPPL
jgi:uncharacterized membrane protein